MTCYRLKRNPPLIVPGGSERRWMDETVQRFAYRCTPLSIANASGWEILTPCAFSATWNGDPAPKGVTLQSPDNEHVRFARSHFGEGIITFEPGYLFRTNSGWAVWVRGTPNLVKDGIAPLDGLVETDWLPMSFTMNWRFTRPGTVQFEAGEPFCFITLVPHAQLDSVGPRLASLDEDPDLKAAYVAWSQSRKAFLAQLAAGEPETLKQGWQRHYIRGEGPDLNGQPSYHLTRRRLKMPQQD
ncbi:hypothetical protein AA309_22360 [Microvirga vignae]|uniref:Uncharacterized protein n=1 Tax=Microvirga vignae TaxID=1225564 RepID=A0A0H1R888_9HYPH|nr:hypothetical protein AA309_22360 [Microvirga vignae]